MKIDNNGSLKVLRRSKDTKHRSSKKASRQSSKALVLQELKDR